MGFTLENLVPIEALKPIGGSNRQLATFDAKYHFSRESIFVVGIM